MPLLPPVTHQSRRGVQERKRKRNARYRRGAPSIRRAQRLAGPGPPFPLKDAWPPRASERTFTGESRHLGERGEAARSNVSGPRPQPSDGPPARIRPSPAGLKGGGFARLGEWDRPARGPAGMCAAGEKEGGAGERNSGSPPGSAVGRARRRRVSGERRPAGAALGRALALVRARNGNCWHPTEMPSPVPCVVSLFPLLFKMDKTPRASE
jgi:hypothetical protein